MLRALAEPWMDAVRVKSLLNNFLGKKKKKMSLL